MEKNVCNNTTYSRCFILQDDLIKIGEVAKKYKGVLKLTSGQRILITNLKQEDLPAIWDELAWSQL